MRIITNSEGYLREVSFGAEITCNGQSCVEYTGSVPSGYDSLAAWAISECERLHRWKIVNGDLVEDTSAPDPTENDLWVGGSARFRTTEDGRGNLQLYKADGTLAVNAYANSGSGGEVDVHDSDGTCKASLYAHAGGHGALQLIDTNGNKHTLTPELIDKIGSGSGSGSGTGTVSSVNGKTGAVTIGAEVVDGEDITPHQVDIEMVGTTRTSVAALSRTTDGRGVLTLKAYENLGLDGLKAYALASGAEIDLHDSTGTRRVALYAGKAKDGRLQLTDADGNSATLTKAKIDSISPRNHLDNSDFRNPVNQRGQTSYTNAYGIDRWRTWDAHVMTIGDGYVKVTGSLFQYLELSDIEDAVYTLAFCDTDGVVHMMSANPTLAYTYDSTANAGLGWDADIGLVVVSIANRSLVWAALYLGEFTAATLPEYHPKGYAAELAACQRYFRRLRLIAVAFGTTSISGDGGYITVVTAPSMRVTPSVSVYDFGGVRVSGNYYKLVDLRAHEKNDYAVTLYATVDTTAIAKDEPMVLINTGFDLSADL